IQSGKVVPLAIGSLTRSNLLPDVPTMDEEGFSKFEAGNWVGIMAPSGVPDSLIKRLEKDFAQAAASDEYRHKLAAQGNESRTSTAAEFAKRIAVDYANNKKLAASLAAAAVQKK